jgi:hypothetical protein
VAGSYRILTSTNLLDWASWQEGYSADSAVELADPDAPLHGRRFYRAFAP